MFILQAGFEIVSVDPPVTHAKKRLCLLLEKKYVVKFFVSVCFSENCLFILFTWDYIKTYFKSVNS